MKKFNLQHEVIVVSKPELLHAINSAKTFAITIEGTIHYAPFENDALYIFQGALPPQPLGLASASAASLFERLFGSSYLVIEDAARVLIRASGAWSQIIAYNFPKADYDDTTADGIADFSDKALEEIGWHATEFGITYREMTEYLESVCEGVLLCIEIEAPYQFSGLGFLRDRGHAREVLFAWCKERIGQIMQSDSDYAIERLNDDEEEAARFFGLL
ncbi:MAG: hypothetical protein JXK05_06540 [Campylobacterales bacterium]|nr:hypothetical protein [Campylobacterales bacterium]